MVFERIAERSFCAVIRGTLLAAWIFLISRLRLRAPFRVQPNLVNVSQHAHQRVRKPATAPTGSLERNRNCDRRLYDQFPSPVSTEIEHRRLPREKSALRRGNHGGEAGPSPRF